MKTVYLFLADGFEEIEALTPVDVLRRGGVEVKTVGLSGKTVNGAHGIAVVADVDGNGFELPQDADMVVLPGGSPGAANLAASEMIKKMLKDADARQLYIAAICAAPTVLYQAGLLMGKRVTAFPAVQGQLTENVTVTGGAVEVDGRIITGRSMGVALPFAHALLAILAGQNDADKVVGNLYPEA